MPRQQKVVSVFVASPSDVADERARLEEVIQDINVAWSRDLGMHLELIRWETHAFPGIGHDAQDVINQQLPEDYDIFIGIMWCRYGTPTGRAGSGTVEEFEHAKKRFDADSSNIKIMFYFKDAPVPPSKIDPGQLEKIAKFRQALGKEGGLYWTFSDLSEFDKLLRLHLTRQIQLLSKPTQAVAEPARSQSLSPVVAAAPEEDELGILDLAEIFESRFSELNSISLRLTAATEELATRMQARTVEITELTAKGPSAVDRHVAKALIAKAASDMDQYVSRVEAELAVFGDNLNSGMNSFIQTATLSAKATPTHAEKAQVEGALDALVSLLQSLGATERNIAEFRGVVSGMPPMTSVLNRSKRRLAEVLDRLIEELRTGQSLCREAERVVRGILSKSDS